MDARIAHWWNVYSVALLGVMLVLLIIFMVVTPLFPFGPPLHTIPVSRTAVKSPDIWGDVFLTITVTGEVYYFDENVLYSELERRLRRAREEQPDCAVRIRVDAHAPFGVARRVTIVARKAGFARVTFLVRMSPR